MANVISHVLAYFPLRASPIGPAWVGILILGTAQLAPFGFKITMCPWEAVIVSLARILSDELFASEVLITCVTLRAGLT